jgi:hypothetical protein
MVNVALWEVLRKLEKEEKEAKRVKRVKREVESQKEDIKYFIFI